MGKLGKLVGTPIKSMFNSKKDCNTLMECFSTSFKPSKYQDIKKSTT